MFDVKKFNFFTVLRQHKNVTFICMQKKGSSRKVVGFLIKGNANYGLSGSLQSEFPSQTLAAPERGIDEQQRKRAINRNLFSSSHNFP